MIVVTVFSQIKLDEMSKIKFTNEELRKRHLSVKITARDRAKELGNEFYEDGGVMFCKACQHSVDYLRRQTALDHLRSARHKNRKASTPGKFYLVIFHYVVNIIKRS